MVLLHGFPSSSAQYDQLMHRLAGSFYVIAPDYPGFGQSPALSGTTTFDRLADVIDAFIEAKGLDRFSVYMFDFGSPVGFRIATRHPERVQGLVLQNGNAYEIGLGPGMRALEPYWQDRAANEAAIRGFLTLEATRSQYMDGVPDPTSVNPDLWELDQRYLEHARSRPGHARPALRLPEQRDAVSGLAANICGPTRRRRCFLGGATTRSSRPRAREAYLEDLPDAELHLLDTGHFATATHSAEIAELITAFLQSRVIAPAAA